MTPEDRAWLRRFNDELASVKKIDLGQRGTNSDKLTDIKERWGADPQWNALARECADIMAFHRDRLIGTPKFSNDPDGKMTSAWKARRKELAARLDAMFREPEPNPEPPLVM